MCYVYTYDVHTYTQTHTVTHTHTHTYTHTHVVFMCCLCWRVLMWCFDVLMTLCWCCVDDCVDDCVDVLWFCVDDYVDVLMTVLMCRCVNVLMCWCIVDMLCVDGIVLMTVLMCCVSVLMIVSMTVDVLMTVLMCRCVIVLMCWCIVDMLCVDVCVLLYNWCVGVSMCDVLMSDRIFFGTQQCCRSKCDLIRAIHRWADRAIRKCDRICLQTVIQQAKSERLQSPKITRCRLLLKRINRILEVNLFHVFVQYSFSKSFEELHFFFCWGFER